MNKLPPITYIPNFIALNLPNLTIPTVTELWNEIDWESRTEARYECWMNDADMDYTYGSGRGMRTYKAKKWLPLAKAIQTELGFLVDSNIPNLEGCFINGYKDDRQNLGYHADDSPEMDETRFIAVVSFGQA